MTACEAFAECTTTAPHHTHSDDDGRSWCCQDTYPYTTPTRPTAPPLSDEEAATVARFEAAPVLPEAWERRRCGTRDCDQFGTHRVDVAEAWYLMCGGHAAEYPDHDVIPPTTFQPSGDGSYRVRCCDCHELVASDQAHVVKATNLAGRANRCEDCGQAAHRRIVAFNRRRCTCTDFCPESDNPCTWCARNLDGYDPCPVIGFGCGTGGNDTRCDCCTDEQWTAAGGAS